MTYAITAVNCLMTDNLKNSLKELYQKKFQNAHPG